MQESVAGRNHCTENNPSLSYIQFPESSLACSAVLEGNNCKIMKRDCCIEKLTL